MSIVLMSIVDLLSSPSWIKPIKDIFQCDLLYAFHLEYNIFHLYDRFLDTRSHDELGVCTLGILEFSNGVVWDRLVSNICALVWNRQFLGMQVVGILWLKFRMQMLIDQNLSVIEAVEIYC